MRYIGGTWQPVGATRFSPAGPSMIGLALDSHDDPYVTFNTNKISVMHYTGGTWQPVGSYNFSPDSADYPSIALDSHDTPFVAFRDMNQAGKASVMNYAVPIGPALCEATGSGLWSVVFSQCAAGDIFVIPTGATVVLDTDIDLSGDFEIQGTFDPNGKTVTLTGSAAQTITGNPLTFYNLVVNKTNKTDTVTVSGKLQVTKKLTLTKGKLKSASDYGDVEIGTEGTLELTNNITVGGTWINDGEFIANTAQVAFDGTTPQAIGGANQTLFYRWVISPTAGVFISTTPAVTDTVENYGVLSQTQTVGPSTVAQFLNVSGGKYNGIDIYTDADTDLGEVSVAVQGNTSQCTSDAGSPAYRHRCFYITSQNDGAGLSLTLYSTAGEDVVTNDDIYQYQNSFSIWAALTAACGSNPGDFCATSGDTSLDAGPNYFLIAGADSPTAVTLNDLSASSHSTDRAPLLMLLAALLGLGGLIFALRRSVALKRISD